MRDRVDFCVVGGIDSRVEPRVLRAAARAGMLKTADVATGFLPGEAGAFFALERQGAGGRAAPAIAIRGWATAHDPHHALADEPPDGAGLTQAVQDCLAQLDVDTQARIGLVVCDLNGEERRAIDWGYCLVRLQPQYRLGDRPLWLPSTSFGDTGCASGAVAICMAARGLQRGYAETSAVAVLLSSDSGGRGMVCLAIS
jgi:3-oxoacyl-[acyl-carrier-protein] synthase-1